MDIVYISLAPVSLPFAGASECGEESFSFLARSVGMVAFLDTDMKYGGLVSHRILLGQCDVCRHSTVGDHGLASLPPRPFTPKGKAGRLTGLDDRTRERCLQTPDEGAGSTDDGDVGRLGRFC